LKSQPPKPPATARRSSETAYSDTLANTDHHDQRSAAGHCRASHHSIDHTDVILATTLPPP
jgi:hypothetical protein